jgi:hypothetical protein
LTREFLLEVVSAQSLSAAKIRPDRGGRLVAPREHASFTVMAKVRSRRNSLPQYWWQMKAIFYTRDVLIFVLDVKPPLDMHRDEEIIESVDWKRLEKHVQEWSDVALSFLFSAMSQRLKLCVVFVNKCNLVKELFGPERERLKREIKDVLSPFIQRLQPRMKGVLLMDILGSARDCEDAAKVRRLIEEKAFSGAPS